MKRIISLIVTCALAIPLNAQTPFDSFAPEATRPMLELEESTNTTSDSVLCAIVADVQNQMLLLVDISTATIVAATPITDDIRKWLSVDPLVDKYPGISPYAYCAWNPIKYLDPDGKKVGIKGVYNNEDGTTSVETFYYDEVDGVRGFYHNGQRLDNELANQATEAIGKIQDGGKYGKMLVDGVVKDDRTIYLCPTKDFTQNQSICDLGKLQWMANDYSSGDMTIPSFITLTHEFAHFISSWYGFADHGVWFRNDGRKVYNDEKWVVNIENLIRNENHLEPRQYYIIPSSPGGSGMGKIPQWGWAKDVLEIVCKF